MVVPQIVLTNRQRKVRLDISRLRNLLDTAIPLCLAHLGGAVAVLPNLDQVEVTLVSDRVIDRVHRQFMNIKGATDVITFDHGEIVVSADTAAREAPERSEPLEREVLRYIVHGLLHLNGHKDAGDDERTTMWRAQEATLEELWPMG